MPFNVGVVSSIDFTKANPSIYKNFIDKLPAGTAVSFHHADGDYDSNSKGEMKKAVRRLFSSKLQFNLAVALGGLVSARALSDYIDAVGSSVPFLAVIGRAPNEGSSLWQNERFIGGVNLDTANQNTYRAQCLSETYDVMVGNTCLLYNEKSHMGERESRDWSFFGKVKKSSVKQSGGYDSSQFAGDFDSLPPGTEAVMVSSDPFFTSKATDIVAAAKGWGKPVCYPNEIYIGANPSPNISMSYGPDLSSAFQLLGKKAADYLNAAKKPATVGLDTPHPGTPHYVTVK